MAERILHRHEIDWEAGGWRLDDVVIEPDGTSSYDAEAEEITVTLRNEDGETEERRLPIFALPRVPNWSSELYDLELTAPQAVEFLPTGLNRRIGDDESNQKLRDTIGKNNNTPAAGDGQQNHEYPAISTLQAALIRNGVYGVVGRVPARQNSRHGGALGAFYARHNLKEGELFLYVHVGLDRAWIEGLPGDKVRGRWARARPYLPK